MFSIVQVVVNQPWMSRNFWIKCKIFFFQKSTNLLIEVSESHVAYLVYLLLVELMEPLGTLLLIIRNVLHGKTPAQTVKTHRANLNLKIAMFISI